MLFKFYIISGIILALWYEFCSLSRELKSDTTYYRQGLQFLADLINGDPTDDLPSSNVGRNFQTFAYFIWTILIFFSQIWLIGLIILGLTVYAIMKAIRYSQEKDLAIAAGKFKNSSLTDSCISITVLIVGGGFYLLS